MFTDTHTVCANTWHFKQHQILNWMFLLDLISHINCDTCTSLPCMAQVYVTARELCSLFHYFTHNCSVSRAAEFSSLFLELQQARPVSWGDVHSPPWWSSFMNFSHGSLLMKNIQRGRGVYITAIAYSIAILWCSAACCCALCCHRIALLTVNSTSIQLNSPAWLRIYLVETEAHNTTNSLLLFIPEQVTILYLPVVNNFHRGDEEDQRQDFAVGNIRCSCCHIFRLCPLFQRQ